MGSEGNYSCFVPFINSLYSIEDVSNPRFDLIIKIIRFLRSLRLSKDFIKLDIFFLAIDNVLISLLEFLEIVITLFFISCISDLIKFRSELIFDEYELKLFSVFNLILKLHWVHA